MTDFGPDSPAAAPGEVAGPGWLRGVMLGALYIFLASSFFSIAVNSLSLGLMAICWVATMMLQRRWSVVSTPLDFYVLAYVLAELLSTACSRDPGQSLFISRRVLLIGIVYFLASNIRDERSVRSVLAVLLGAATLVGLVGLLKLLVVKPEETVRLGIFQFYMTTSELMMMSALLVFPYVIHPSTPWRMRLLAIGTLPPILVSLYATVTRGAYVAFGGGILFIALVRNKKLLVPLVILIVLMILFAPPYIQQRMMSIVDVHHPENASRIMMWKAGVKIFADHPLVGVGDIDLGELLCAYAEPGYPGLWGHVHNMPLQFLVTLGLVGFVAVSAMFVKIFVTEWRIYRQVHTDWFRGSLSLGALAVFVGFHINGLTEWTFGDQEVVILFWITLGIALAVGRLPFRGKKEA